MDDLHVGVINKTKMLSEKLEKLNKDKIPQHVAIIMDGNGRWAKKRGMLRTFGHQSAIKSVRDAIEFCKEIDVPYLTLYAFSTENWKRPQSEVSTLMSLLISTIKKEFKKLNEKGICLKVIGDISKFPPKVIDELSFITNLTQNNTQGTLILALNYGAKEEILKAVKKIAQEVKEDILTLDQINEKTVEDHLYTKNIPPVDLLIRTSGEQRISNFLLWQLSYAELYFTETLWPDFKKEDFYKAILYYQNRERRFGKISEQLNVE